MEEATIIDLLLEEKRLAESRHSEIKEDIERLEDKFDAHEKASAADSAVLRAHTEELSTLKMKVYKGNGQPSFESHIAELHAWSKSFEKSWQWQKYAMCASIGFLYTFIFLV